MAGLWAPGLLAWALCLCLAPPSHAVSKTITVFDSLTDPATNLDSYNTQFGILIGTSSQWGNGPVFVPELGGQLHRVDGGFYAVDPGLTMVMSLFSMKNGAPDQRIDWVELVVPLDTASASVLSFTGWDAEIAAGEAYFLRAEQARRGSVWGQARQGTDLGISLGEYRVRGGVPEGAGPIHLAHRVHVTEPVIMSTVPPPAAALSMLWICVVLFGRRWAQRVFSVSRRVT